MFTDLQHDAPNAEPAVTPVRPTRSWFDLAHALARSGRYRDVAEVEAALQAGGETTAPSLNPIVRDAIDIACARARDEDWAGVRP